MLWPAILFLFARQPAPQQVAQTLTAARLKPTGSYYRAVVPDTLDLAERARLSVHGLTSFLNPRANYAPYGHTYYDANPPYLSDLPGGPPNWGKIVESLLMARSMCGSTENLEAEAASIRGMLSPPVLSADGKTDAYSHDYLVINGAAPTPLSRAMIALMALQRISPDPALKALIDHDAQDHVAAGIRKGDLQFYADPPPDMSDSRLGVQRTGFQAFVQGCAIRALCRWAEVNPNPAYLDAAGRLSKFILQDRFWQPVAGSKAVVSADRGQFDGHAHSYTQCLMGLLWYANETHNARLKEFVRSSYEYLRNFGIARLGNFGEACTTGDMTYLALKLSDTGIGDYWDDADQYIRNHLAELQITDAAKLRRAVEQMPHRRGRWDSATGPFDPLNESADHVVERNVGVFFSDATHPALIPDHSFMATICCTGNCTPALYAAWDSIVRYKNGAAQVNLLLNRASPWLDVDSYLPYEGKVVIHNKTAKQISVRMPRWVDLSAVHAEIDGHPIAPIPAGRYLVFPSVAKSARVTIAFPVVETVETYRAAWKQSDFWQECTDPGSAWKPDADLATYTCRFRGNTLVDISPRDQGPGYLLYQRSEMRATRAPMKTVERYIAPVLPRW
jgi:hypothetical protein